jgi:hypothetical protein
LRHGAVGFTSPPKEDVLRIFIAIDATLCPKTMEKKTLGAIKKERKKSI